MPHLNAPSGWPQLAEAVEPLLLRMRREDLALQLHGKPLRQTEDRPAGRRSFILAGGRRRYSLELDFAHWLAEVDVGEGERVIALHILPPQD
jgi:hypothetical protein